MTYVMHRRVEIAPRAGLDAAGNLRKRDAKNRSVVSRQWGLVKPVQDGSYQGERLGLKRAKRQVLTLEESR